MHTTLLNMDKEYEIDEEQIQDIEIGSFPPLKEQKRIVKKIEKKVRTSFELTEDSLKKLEFRAKQLGETPSDILRSMLHFATIEPDDKNQKRLKNFTVDQWSMEKIKTIGESLIPKRLRGKRGINKSYVVELIIQKSFKKLDEYERLLEKYGDLDDDDEI